MRMRVRFRRLAVGRPAGVPDADRAAQRLFLQARFQVGQPPDRLADLQSALGEYGHAGRIVSAVLQFLEPFQQNRL